MDTEHIAERLVRRFGLGTRADLRKALYLRLEKIVEDEGEPAYLVIATCVADANGKDDPGRYFSKIVLLRLMERGIIDSPEI